jgi:protein-S-isoprenylcysteine O-methyltransferase Ste14
MSVSPQSNRVDERSDLIEKVSWKRWVFGFSVMIGLPAMVLFGASGHLDWWMAWIYIGLATLFSMTSRIIMLRKHPSLIAERAKFTERQNAKPWDRVLAPLVATLGPMVMLLVAGLDMRFRWSKGLPLELQIAGLVITALGYIPGVWASAENKYFSAVVRIQHDRGHATVTSGPCQYIRHPGYAGGILVNFAMAFALNSLWVLVPALFASSLIIIRTYLEDKTLQDELEGYREYAGRVRYRLFPGLW